MNYQVLFDFPANSLETLERAAFIYEIILHPPKEKMELVMAATKVMVRDHRINSAVTRVLKEFSDDDYLKILTVKEIMEHVKVVPLEEKRIVEG